MDKIIPISRMISLHVGVFIGLARVDCKMYISVNTSSIWGALEWLGGGGRVHLSYLEGAMQIYTPD